MSALGPEGDAVMAMIAGRALERNRDRVAGLAELLAGDLDGPDGDAREQAVTLAHQIAGSAGTFGYDAASDIARAAMNLLSDGAAPGEVEPLAAQIKALLEQPPA